MRFSMAASSNNSAWAVAAASGDAARGASISSARAPGGVFLQVQSKLRRRAFRTNLACLYEAVLV